MPRTISGLAFVPIGLMMALEGLLLPSNVQKLTGLGITIVGCLLIRLGMSQGGRLGIAYWKSELLKQWLRFCAAWIPLAIVFYAAGYFLLMNRHRPTTPAGAYYKFESSFRWAPNDVDKKPQSGPPWPAVTLWNVIYSPMDKFYFRISPRTSAEVEKLGSVGYSR